MIFTLVYLLSLLYYLSIYYQQKARALTQRGVHEHGVVELHRGVGHVDGLDLVKGAQGMAFGHEFGDGPLVEGPSDQKNYVVDHITDKKKSHRATIINLLSTIYPHPEF